MQPHAMFLSRALVEDLLVVRLFCRRWVESASQGPHEFTPVAKQTPPCYFGSSNFDTETPTTGTLTTLTDADPIGVGELFMKLLIDVEIYIRRRLFSLRQPIPSSPRLLWSSDQELLEEHPGVATGLLPGTSDSDAVDEGERSSTSTTTTAATAAAPALFLNDVARCQHRVERVQRLCLDHLDQSFDLWSIRANVSAAVGAPYIDIYEGDGALISQVTVFTRALARYDTAVTNEFCEHLLLNVVAKVWPVLRKGWSEVSSHMPETITVESVGVLLSCFQQRSNSGSRQQSNPAVAAAGLSTGVGVGMQKTQSKLWKDAKELYLACYRLLLSTIAIDSKRKNILNASGSSDADGFKVSFSKKSSSSSKTSAKKKNAQQQSTTDSLSAGSGSGSFVFKDAAARRKASRGTAAKRPREDSPAEPAPRTTVGKKRGCGLAPLPLELQREILTYLTPRSLQCAVVSCYLWWDIVCHTTPMSSAMGRAVRIRSVYRRFFEDDWGEFVDTVGMTPTFGNLFCGFLHTVLEPLLPASSSSRAPVVRAPQLQQQYLPTEETERADACDRDKERTEKEKKEALQLLEANPSAVVIILAMMWMCMYLDMVQDRR